MSKKRSSSSAKRTRKKRSSNTKTGHHYENVVRRIMKELKRELKKRLPGQHVKVSKPREQVRGHSRYSHRIDLSVRWQASLTLLECKCWKRGIDPGAVLCMFARVCDIQKALPGTTVSGAMVTKNRIGPGAKKLTAAFGLKLYDVQNEREFGVELAGDIHRRIKEERVRPKDSELYVELQPADRSPQ